ncbi:uncharacterized protein MAM_05583 [Metarhizium album ARSEF 1941]|uniref:Uncharacterized protein n=1 Tax=Metarhizium album (strain ARSEF 1941) TaxID=1081103 RepID=A0A0B2WUK4_METAS|nr:uncharacterized protein MAM_05583 [Metarhizium album ARSEF 1941]KHN96640.1 hypothetical protein MAM_05583 [Metarhizium album ARSEF 1941]
MPATDTSGKSTEPLVWVIIPLIAVFSVGTFVLFIWNRQRKRSSLNRNELPEDRVLVGSSYIRCRRGMRWSPWSETRSVEGLNELGEAPPPYDSKKPPAIHDQLAERREETGQEGSELRDLETGRRPPAYPAPPQPVATRDRRTS